MHLLRTTTRYGVRCIRFPQPIVSNVAFLWYNLQTMLPIQSDGESFVTSTARQHSASAIN